MYITKHSVPPTTRVTTIHRIRALRAPCRIRRYQNTQIVHRRECANKEIDKDVVRDLPIKSTSLELNSAYAIRTPRAVSFPSGRERAFHSDLERPKTSTTLGEVEEPIQGR